MRCSRRPRRICLPADRRRHRRRARLSRDHRGPPAAHAASPLEAAHQDHSDDDRGAPGRWDRVRFRSRVVEPGHSRPAGHRRQAARRLLERGCHLALAPIHDDDGDEGNSETPSTHHVSSMRPRRSRVRTRASNQATNAHAARPSAEARARQDQGRRADRRAGPSESRPSHGSPASDESGSNRCCGSGHPCAL